MKRTVLTEKSGNVEVKIFSVILYRLPN